MRIEYSLTKNITSKAITPNLGNEDSLPFKLPTVTETRKTKRRMSLQAITMSYQYEEYVRNGGS